MEGICTLTQGSLCKMDDRFVHDIQFDLIITKTSLSYRHLIDPPRDDREEFLRICIVNIIDYFSIKNHIQNTGF